MNEPNQKPEPYLEPHGGPDPNVHPDADPSVKTISDQEAALSVKGGGLGGVAGLDTQAYHVGYKRPPQQHRFQKGKSGNPKGRPKWKRSRKAIAERVLLEKRTVDIDGRARELSMIALVVLALRHEAMKGKARAFKEYRSVEVRYGPQENNGKAGYLRIPYVETMEQWTALWGPDGSGWKQVPRK